MPWLRDHGFGLALIGLLILLFVVVPLFVERPPTDVVILP